MTKDSKIKFYRFIIYKFIIIICITETVQAQNQWITDQSSFTEIVKKEFSHHPLLTDSEEKYVAYFIEIHLQNGLISNITYSKTTPKLVIERSRKSLQILNDRIEESGIEILGDCIAILPVFNIWSSDEIHKDNLLNSLSSLFPEKTFEGCTAFLDPLTLVISKPIR
jgi:hypothetical protein